jgi:sugar lactone lactonase YvrE/DNA-binding NarL/FixJ family response regulator
MPEKPLSCVLLADRHHGLTEGVRGLLETAFGTVVMVADEASLLEGASRLRPDVAVVDLSLAGGGGLGWLRTLRERCPELKVVVLSVHDEESVHRAAVEAGADAFVLKRALVTDLLPAVARVRGDSGGVRPQPDQPLQQGIVKEIAVKRSDTVSIAVPRFTDFEIAVPPTAALGEGPRWDEVSATLLWVDIPGRSVHRYDPATGHDEVQQVSDVVSLAVPRRRGGVVVGLPDGLHLLNGKQSLRLVAIEPERPDTRTNDGACDAAGRLWVGTMALDERSPVGALYRVDPDHSVTTILTGTTISNGLGWSPSGTSFYFIDSPTHRVDVFDFDVATGTLENRRPFAAVKVKGAVPDGLTVDAEGGVWAALHGGWGLNRYSPDGELVAEVRLPVAKVTSCCFGGPELRDLYVTTRRDGLSDAEVARQPLSGALLRLDVGVAGLPTDAFAG